MVTLLSVLFLSSWWNKYLSPMSGGELTSVYLYRCGLLPYRDYFASAPPGTTLIALALSNLFGNHLIAYWAFGATLRVIGAVCAYLWLCRLVRPIWAIFAVICAFVFSSVDIADTPYFYNHLASTFSLLAAFALTGTFERSWKHRAFFGLLSGLLLGSSLLIKQTTGVISFAMLIGSLCLLFGSKKAWGRLSVALVSFSVGITIPVLGLLSWFYAKGILPAFIDQVFVRGPSSKGGALMSLLRPITMTIRYTDFSVPAFLCLVLVAISWIAYIQVKQNEMHTDSYWWLALPALLFALLIGKNTSIPPLQLHTTFMSITYLAMVGCLSICFWAAANLLFGCWKKKNHTDLVMMAAVGFACAYALSISWPAFEVMIFPGAALLFALVLEWGGPSRISPLVRSMIITSLLFLVTVSVVRKHNTPFYWGRWTEPPLITSTYEAKAPELTGFKLSPWTASFFDNVSETIQTYSGPEDRIFVYPNMPILYALANRLPATFGLTHWVDVCPDFVADTDAQRLISSPPAVIVVHPDLPEELANEEAIFRGGQHSGIRNILIALKVIRPQYQVVGLYQVPGHPVPIQVWALTTTLMHKMQQE